MNGGQPTMGMKHYFSDRLEEFRKLNPSLAHMMDDTTLLLLITHVTTGFPLFFQNDRHGLMFQSKAFEKLFKMLFGLHTVVLDSRTTSPSDLETVLSQLTDSSPSTQESPLQRLIARQPEQRTTMKSEISALSTVTAGQAPQVDEMEMHSLLDSPLSLSEPISPSHSPLPESDSSPETETGSSDPVPRQFTPPPLVVDDTGSVFSVTALGENDGSEPPDQAPQTPALAGGRSRLQSSQGLRGAARFQLWQGEQGDPKQDRALSGYQLYYAAFKLCSQIQQELASAQGAVGHDEAASKGRLRRYERNLHRSLRDLDDRGMLYEENGPKQPSREELRGYHGEKLAIAVTHLLLDRYPESQRPFLRVPTIEPEEGNDNSTVGGTITSVLGTISPIRFRQLPETPGCGLILQPSLLCPSAINTISLASSVSERYKAFFPWSGVGGGPQQNSQLIGVLPSAVDPKPAMTILLLDNTEALQSSSAAVLYSYLTGHYKPPSVAVFALGRSMPAFLRRFFLPILVSQQRDVVASTLHCSAEESVQFSPRYASGNPLHEPLISSAELSKALSLLPSVELSQQLIGITLEAVVAARQSATENVVRAGLDAQLSATGPQTGRPPREINVTRQVGPPGRVLSFYETDHTLFTPLRDRDQFAVPTIHFDSDLTCRESIIAIPPDSSALYSILGLSRAIAAAAHRAWVVPADVRTAFLVVLCASTKPAPGCSFSHLYNFYSEFLQYIV